MLVDDPTVTTYRPPVPVPLAWVVATVFFLVGLSMAVGYQSVGGISSLVMGILACAFAVVVARNIAGNKLVVSHEGLSLWRLLRNQDIPWGEVRGFEIGTVSWLSSRSAVVIILDSEKFPISATRGSEERASVIMADLNAAHQRYLALRQSQP
jgi:hypothetical protein